mmetsp:Transcript_11051/g.27187  ORF Transcript_11051/g.27187 Transcript_11051/m.27187 type:complete len:274 (-) Transcript_11051:432-1253(-)
MTSGEGVEISQFDDTEGGWVNTTPTSDSEAPEAIIQLPEASDAVDVEDPYAYDTADGAGTSGSCRCTKKKLGLMLLATTALLALTIGLGVGLGTRKNGAVSNNNGARDVPAAEAAIDDVTLAECLAIVDAESAAVDVDAASDQSPATDEPMVAVPALAKDGDDAEDDLSIYSNDFEDAALAIATGSNDGIHVQVVSMSETSYGVSKLMTAVSPRRATNDSGDGEFVRRRKLRVLGSRTGSVANEVVADLKASSAKARRMEQCADLIEEANSSS